MGLRNIVGWGCRGFALLPCAVVRTTSSSRIYNQSINIYCRHLVILIGIKTPHVTKSPRFGTEGHRICRIS